MPLSESDYAEPAWVRYKKGYTIARNTDKRSRFINFESYPRNYRGGVFKQPGYNPNHQAIRVQRVNLYRDDLTLKPR